MDTLELDGLEDVLLDTLELMLVDEVVVVGVDTLELAELEDVLVDELDELDVLFVVKEDTKIKVKFEGKVINVTEDG